jgi:GNAT superfamily N-acetyltransferase
MTTATGSSGPASTAEPASTPDPAVGVAPAVAAEPRTDTSPAGLLSAIHDDVVRSATRRRTIGGERVVRTTELTAYRSDIASPDVNVVIEAHFAAGADADRAIDETIAFFDGRPFLWWVGERDAPPDLGDRLARHGVMFLDEIPGMAMDLADLVGPGDAPPPPELEVAPVLDVAAIDAFHEVLVQGFPEDFADDGVKAAIAASSTRIATETDFREPNGLPTRWIGTVAGRPVTTTRLHTAAGVAGIYTVITAASARRRGYGGAITRHVLQAARDHGLRIATLQASPSGRGVYERIGFRELCGYRLHEWRPE